MRELKRWTVHLSARHLHGPKKIAYAPDELVVVCLVRDGRPYIRAFIDHYLSLGVKHIVFLDNDSGDGTVAVAREYERVTVIQSKLPYKNYQFAMKAYLISRFGKGRWSLYVDIDELFDYPYSDVVSLSSLLRYLNEKSYTAVTAQHLDMFSDGALSNPISKKDKKDEPLKELYRLYDISNISREDYSGRFDRKSNTIANDNIKIHNGGIRKTLFDGNPRLTKHPLIFVDGKVRHGDMGFHRIKNARIADFSCVLYHYKLVGGLREQLARDLQEGRYPRVLLPGYTQYHDVLEQNPDINIKQDTARELGSVDELIDNEFIVVSEEYRKWADRERGTQDRHPHRRDQGPGERS